MSDKLLDQADALMRRRVFVAGSSNGAAVADDSVQFEESIAPATDSALEDVPVLTDVVVAQDFQPHADDALNLKPEEIMARQWEANASLHFKQLLMERQSVLAREIETWLDEQMPQLVIRAMDGITDHLVALLANRARDDLLPRLETALQAPDEAATDADSTE